MVHVFVVNPAAGQGGREGEIRQKLAKYGDGLEYELYRTSAPGDATRFVKDWCRTHPDRTVRFYACGGDGTLNEVVNGAVEFSQASVTAFACGSGNDYVKYYGGAAPFLDLDKLIQAEERPVDLIRVGDRYCINICHFGFDTVVAKTMAQVKRKRFLGGKNAYTTGVVVALFKAMKNHCVVRVDGEALNRRDMLLCTVANGKYVGGMFQCAPRSLNDDGLLDVCMVRPVSRLTFVALVRLYAQGRHLEDRRLQRYVVYRRGRRVELEAEEGFAISLDGEILDGSRFAIEVVPHGIRFAVPKGAAAPTQTKEKGKQRAEAAV